MLGIFINMIMIMIITIITFVLHLFFRGKRVLKVKKYHY